MICFIFSDGVLDGLPKLLINFHDFTLIENLVSDAHINGINRFIIISTGNHSKLKLEREYIQDKYNIKVKYIANENILEAIKNSTMFLAEDVLFFNGDNYYDIDLIKNIIKNKKSAIYLDNNEEIGLYKIVKSDLDTFNEFDADFKDLFKEIAKKIDFKYLNAEDKDWMKFSSVDDIYTVQELIDKQKTELFWWYWYRFEVFLSYETEFCYIVIKIFWFNVNEFF